MAIIRHEINLIDTPVVSSSGTVISSAITYFDPTLYSGTIAVYFEVVATNTSSTNWGQAVNRKLPLSDGGSVNIPTDTTTMTRFRSGNLWGDSITAACSLSAGAHLASGGTVTVKAARLIIIQDTSTDPLTSTETQIEIGAQQTGNVNTTLAPLTNPKYWYYDSTKWDGTCTFYAECTNFQTGSGVITIKLQEDDGSFGSWTDKVTIVNAATPSSVTRTRSASFTPTSGRNYRIVGMVANSMDTWAIYNAKIIVQQSGIRDAFQPVGGTLDVSFSLYGETGTNEKIAQSFLTTSAYSVPKVVVRQLWKSFSPTDNVYLDIVSDSGGSVGGTVLGTSNAVAASGLTGSPVDTPFTFSSPVSLSNATTYWLVLRRDGTRSTVNCVNWNGISTGGYSSGLSAVMGSGSWSYDSTDLGFEIYSGITKLEPQYLLINSATTTTGLNDFDTYFDPAEWSGVTNAYYHEQNASLNTSNTKLQSDPSGTPADVTNSSVTGGSATAADSRKRGSAMTMPGTAQTIDANVVSA